MRWPWSRKPEKKDAELTLDQLVSRRFQLYLQTAALEPITAETALNAPTFFSVVHLISRLIASLPIDVVRAEGDERIPQPKHPLAQLLNLKPNRYQSRCLYWSKVTHDLLTAGNFYAYKSVTRVPFRVLQLHPQQPHAVSVDQQDDYSLLYRVNLKNGETRELGQAEIHHIRGLVSSDGIVGESPVLRLREGLALEIAAEKFGAQVFGSGNLPSGIVERPGHFTDDEARERFSRTWDAAFRKRRKTAVLEDGWKFTPLQLTNEASQFLETRRLQREIIAGALGIPPPAVGILERATFNNVAELGLWLVVHLLTPFLCAIEQQIWLDLLSERDQLNHQVKFNVKALLRGAPKDRAESLKLMREWGIINANEWRALEDMQKIEGPAGDTYLRPLNMSDASKEPEDPKLSAEPGQDSSAAA